MQVLTVKFISVLDSPGNFKSTGDWFRIQAVSRAIFLERDLVKIYGRPIHVVPKWHVNILDTTVSTQAKLLCPLETWLTRP